ncbi:MAG: MFS transporter [Erysipelotrichaceae bacterium]|nr:MFS transporter [Erysipelotrichaceae bacterium]
MNKKINYLHGTALVLYEMYAGFTFSFGSYILLEKGFSSTMAGIIMSIGNVVGFILQPFISDITDKSKTLTIIQVLIIETAFAFGACMLNVIELSPNVIAAFAFITIIATVSLLEALYNSAHFILNDNNYAVNFQRARAFGSIGFGTFSFLLGVLFERLPFRVALSLGSLVCLLTMIVLTVLNHNVNIDKNNNNKDEEEITYSQFLHNHPNCIKVIVSFVFIFLGYTLIDNFYVLKLNAIGVGSTSLGLIILIKTLMEFPSFYIYKKIELKFGTKRCLIFSAFMFVIKNLIIFLAPNTVMLCVAQICQAGSYGLILPAMISYINQATNKKETVRGQALFSMGIGFGAILSSALAGVIFDNLGLNALFISALVIGIVSAFFFTHYVLKNEN